MFCAVLTLLHRCTFRYGHRGDRFTFTRATVLFFLIIVKYTIQTHRPCHFYDLWSGRYFITITLDVIYHHGRRLFILQFSTKNFQRKEKFNNNKTFNKCTCVIDIAEKITSPGYKYNEFCTRRRNLSYTSINVLLARVG